MFYRFWVAAILDFGKWATSKMLFDATTVLGIPKNPIIDTKIVLLRSYQKLYAFLFWRWPDGGHFGKWLFSGFCYKFQNST